MMICAFEITIMHHYLHLEIPGESFTMKQKLLSFFNVSFSTLAYSVSKTRFFIGRQPYIPVVRDLVITNTFDFPLLIYRVLVAADIQDSITVRYLANRKNLHHYVGLYSYLLMFIYIRFTISTFMKGLTNGDVYVFILMIYPVWKTSLFSFFLPSIFFVCSFFVLFHFSFRWNKWFRDSFYFSPLIAMCRITISKKYKNIFHLHFLIIDC